MTKKRSQNALKHIRECNYEEHLNDNIEDPTVQQIVQMEGESKEYSMDESLEYQETDQDTCGVIFS